MVSYRTDNLKYIALFQGSLKDLLTPPGYFTFSLFHRLFIICLKSFMLKETSPLTCILYIVYFEFLLYNILNSARRFKYWHTFLKRRLLFPKNYICCS